MKRALGQVVKVTSAVWDLAARRPAGMTVLIYHRVGGIGGSVDLDPGRFEAQIEELAATGNVCSLDAGIEAIAQEGAEASVVITFDDGTIDFVEKAVPILERHRVPATLYLATRFVDEGIEFPGGGPAVSWEGLRDACSTGLVDIGSHTHSHTLLDRLPTAEVADQLDRSIGLIEGNLQRTPKHFAYPKAVLGSPDAERAIRSRFASAAIAGTRANLPADTDLYRIQRSPIQVADGMRWFRRKANGGMALEDDLRQLVNRRRYADATT